MEWQRSHVPFSSRCPLAGQKRQIQSAGGVTSDNKSNVAAFLCVCVHMQGSFPAQAVIHELQNIGQFHTPPDWLENIQPAWLSAQRHPRRRAPCSSWQGAHPPVTAVRRERFVCLNLETSRSVTGQCADGSCSSHISRK